MKLVARLTKLLTRAAAANSVEVSTGSPASWDPRGADLVRDQMDAELPEERPGTPAG
jgi:hypothetical protein